MRKSAIVLLTIFAIFISVFFADKTACILSENFFKQSAASLKIVSLSPAITETIYMLGFDKYLAGVTRYCDYPEDALSKPKIGGYYDPNIEMIASVNPDYVILGTEHIPIENKLQRLNLKTVMLDFSSPKSIQSSILTLGSLFGEPGKAELIVQKMQSKIRFFGEITRELPEHRVMIVFGEDMAGEVKNKMYIVGNDNFYTPILHIVGAKNVIARKDMLYPLVSVESIMHLNPDVIIELQADMKDSQKAAKNVVERWKNLSMVNAVKNHRVYVINEDYVNIPGPRFINIAEDFLKIIHPEIIEKLN